MDARAEVEALRARWRERFNEGRTTELADLFYAANAIALPPASDPVVGRAAIAQFLRGAHEAGAVSLELGVLETHEADDLLVLVGTYAFADADGVEHGGFTHETFRREGDGWKCVVDMWHPGP